MSASGIYQPLLKQMHTLHTEYVNGSSGKTVTSA